MIAYLEGQILRSEANLIVLKTSDGVGYAVHVSQHLAVKASPEEFITLHIYTNVREDDISLYGFQKLEEKDIIVMCDVGAYGMSLSSNYNVRAKPAEILIKGSKINVIKNSFYGNA